MNLDDKTIKQLKGMQDSRTKRLAQFVVTAAFAGAFALLAGVDPARAVLAGILGAGCAWYGVALLFIAGALIALATQAPGQAE